MTLGKKKLYMQKEIRGVIYSTLHSSSVNDIYEL